MISKIQKFIDWLGNVLVYACHARYGVILRKQRKIIKKDFK